MSSDGVLREHGRLRRRHRTSSYESSSQVKIAKFHRLWAQSTPRAVLRFLELLRSLGAILMPPVQLIRELLRRRRWARLSYYYHDENETTKVRLEQEGPNWILDSGAWMHHTSNLELLIEGRDFSRFRQDIARKDDAPWDDDDDDNDNPPHVLLGRGSVRTKCFEFPGVRYVVGDDTRNVVSVAQLARDHGLVTVFEPTSCHVKDKKTGRIVGKGRLRNGTYMLDSLRIVGQYAGDRSGASGGDRRDGADGGGGGGGREGRGNGEGDSIGEGRGGGGRHGRGEETGSRSQEKGSGIGTAGRDVNEINEEGNNEKEIEEIIENDEDDTKQIGEINGEGEKEDDEKRRQNFGQPSSRPHTGLFGMSRFASILLPYTSWGAGVTILTMDFHSLAGFWVLFILGFQLLKTCFMQSTICNRKQIDSLFQGTSRDGESEEEEEETWGACLQGLSHQEHNKRLFGLSRFDATKDPTGYQSCQLPARAFVSSTNAACRPEVFFVDSGASYHTKWNESILSPYPWYLENHTKPPTLSLGGIAAGSIPVTRTGYLNSSKIMLDGVLLAPEAQANLVSVGQLSIYYGVQVEMDDVGIVIKKKQNGVQIGRGNIVGNLYVLEQFLPGGLFVNHFPTPQP